MRTIIVLFSIITLNAQPNLLLFGDDSFTLTDLSNLDLWVDYDDSTPETSVLTTTGAPDNEITAITDISGNGRTISVVTNPIDSSSSGIYFSGDDYFTVNAIATNYDGEDLPHTFVCVYKSGDLVNFQSLFSVGLSSSSSSYHYYGTDDTPNFWSQRKVTATKNFDAGTPVDDAYVIIVAIFSGTVLNVFVNGARVGLEDTDMNVEVQNHDRYAIGVLLRNTAALQFVGLMKAFATFTREITDSERASIESYYGF